MLTYTGRTKRLILLAAWITLLSGATYGQTVPKRLHYLDHLLDTSPLFDTTRLAVTPLALVDTIADDWREWHTVDNFHYGKNRGSLPMIADLRALHPYFRKKVEELITACRKQGIELAIVETYRTPSKQTEYYAMGRKYTRTPGGRSRHQYGLAVDIVPIVDSIAVWNNHKLWRRIGLAGEKLGLRWGGRWRALYDPGHFEWSGGLTLYHLARGAQPVIPQAHRDLFPSLENELTQLQESWHAWEVEQSATAKKNSSREDGIGAAN